MRNISGMLYNWTKDVIVEIEFANPAFCIKTNDELSDSIFQILGHTIDLQNDFKLIEIETKDLKLLSPEYIENKCSVAII